MCYGMKSKKRSERRYQRERAIQHARHIVRFCWGYRAGGGHGREEEKMLLWARKFAESLPTCSCIMCGMPRKFHGPTVQERRQEEPAHVPPTYHSLGRKRHYRPSWKPAGEIIERKLAPGLAKMREHLRQLLWEME